MSARKPARRTSGVVVQALGDEVIVYDLERHRAHSLEPRAAAIWNACDGETTLAGIARAVSGDGPALDDAVVRVVLERLDRAHLLAQPIAREDEPARSRREILRRAAALGGLSVLTVAMPSSAAPRNCGLGGGKNCGCLDTEACYQTGSGCVCLPKNPSLTLCGKCPP